MAAGDDSESHQVRFEIDSSSSVGQLIDEALRHCRLASIAGGEATWLIAACNHGRPRGSWIVNKHWDDPAPVAAI